MVKHRNREEGCFIACLLALRTRKHRTNQGGEGVQAADKQTSAAPSHHIQYFVGINLGVIVWFYLTSNPTAALAVNRATENRLPPPQEKTGG